MEIKSSECFFVTQSVQRTHHILYSCFPHVINLAVQAIYAALKDRKGLEQQYLLGGGHINEAAVKQMVLPQGVTRDDYVQVLAADVLGTARKLIAACRISGKRREEFLDTILHGNTNETWKDDDGNPISMNALQLLRDCETRWSSTYLMVDRVLVMLPVCLTAISVYLLWFDSSLGHQSISSTPKSIGRQYYITRHRRGLCSRSRLGCNVCTT